MPCAGKTRERQWPPLWVPKTKQRPRTPEYEALPRRRGPCIPSPAHRPMAPTLSPSLARLHTPTPRAADVLDLGRRIVELAWTAVANENSIRPEITCKARIVSSSRRMLGMVVLLLDWLASLLKSRRRLQAENLVLRHQLNILHRRAPQRMRCRSPVVRLALSPLPGHD
jgi:hypothetical protein